MPPPISSPSPSWRPHAHSWRTASLRLHASTRGASPHVETARAVTQFLTGLVGIPLELKDLDREVEDLRKKMEKLRPSEPGEAKEGEEKLSDEDKGRYIT